MTNEKIDQLLNDVMTDNIVGADAAYTEILSDKLESIRTLKKIDIASNMYKEPSGE